MSAGLPVIASRIGGLPELVADGDNGFLFDPPSSEQLAAHILRLQGDTALRQRMGERSRMRAAEQFDLQVCVDRWADLLMSI
jgi:glycosyltransferase involved in cell wall biosynthesis